MTRYEEAVDKLMEAVESIKIAQDEFDTQIEDDLRAFADIVRFEFQMMQIERKECVRPTTLV